jgi:hypothetical protein
LLISQGFFALSEQLQNNPRMHTPDNTDADLCPFSKPILGDWCECPHAQVMDRCSGKMNCTSRTGHRKQCLRLVELLRNNARFVLGLTEASHQLTHSKYMKIKCGGIQGMQRMLEESPQNIPLITEVVADVLDLYGSLEKFPYCEIANDIRQFNHRKSSRK